MLKTCLLLTFLFISLNLTFSQRDSIFDVIRNTENDSILLRSYLALSDQFYQIEPDSCRFYNEKAYIHAQNIGSRFHSAAIENGIGLCELHKENYGDALIWFKKSLEKLILERKERASLMVMNNIGASYSELQQPVKALPYLLKAQEYAQNIEDYPLLLLAELNLGNVYEDLNQIKLAEEYYRKSKSRTTLEDDPYNFALCSYNIGAIQLKREINTEVAINELIESYEIALDYKFYNLAFMASNSIIEFYLIDNYLDLDLAKKWIDSCDNVLIHHQYPTAFMFNRLNKGIYFRKIGDLKESLNQFLQGKELTEDVQENEVKFQLGFALSKTYEEMGKYELALKEFQQASEKKEELFNSKNTMIFADLKTNYELEKKDQEIAIASKDSAIKDEKIKSDQNRIQFFIVGTVLLLILLVFIIYFLLVKNKNNKLLQTQNELIEEQRASIEHKQTEIIDSINYASRIQSAIIPEQATLKKQLKDGFVLYLPKDVVSGDFYWTEQLSDHEVLVAVADCTGHGVPGAMVSIVCNNALNRAVREFELKKPGQILDKTREIVIDEFQQHDSSVKDGMDISLALINFKTSQLQWAGANNPLWIIRKENNSKIEEYKADKQPIGQFHHPQPFSNHLIDINKGDRFYLFSDGFADQFGGEKGKKMKNKAFKQFLLKHSTTDMDQIKVELNQVFDQWKGSFEQLDDVCIIGITFS